MSNAPFNVHNALLRWALQLDRCERVYRAAQSIGSRPFVDRVLEALRITPVVDDVELGRIPSTGAVVIAANHPRGAIDGLVLAALVGRRRPDVRILANHLLARIPELEDICFFVDPFDGASAAARSQAGLRGAHLWLKSGGALVVFPAGEVAHDGPLGGRVDSPWHRSVGRLVSACGAAVIPAWVDGENSRLFYAAGRVHPRLRTALLPREMLRAAGGRVQVRLGRQISLAPRRSSTTSAAEVTRQIRATVDGLRNPALVAPASADKLEADITALPHDARLVEDGAFEVFCAPARAIPHVLSEIGRLREVTYRAAGEGTGRPTDLDRFDDYYLHLFGWDRRERRIVGAYRMGETDRILAHEGAPGLYTRTLFQYDARLMARLSPALELGRSFVRAEYQRNYSALLSLWKGIGQFVVRHPQYRILFGTVSVSAHYTSHTHQLLMRFLSQNHRDADLAGLAVALNPPRMEPPAQSAPAPASIDEVNRLVSASEPDGKGVPVLLRQYLKLGARLLGFNIDPQFGDALDALMMVDLTKVDRRILKQYLGREGAASFLSAHGHTTTVAA